MRQRQSPKNYSKLKYYLLGLFLCALAFAGLFLANQYFTIKHVELISPGGRIKVNGLENFRQKNILLVSDKEIISTLKQSNPQLKNIRVEKQYPDQLIISVETDSSVAALKVNQGYFLLNQSGKLLSKDRNSSAGLPQINYYQQLNYNAYNLGDQIDLQDIVISLHFAKKMRETGLSVLSIDIGGVDVIRLNLQNKQVIVFSTEKDIELQDFQFEKIIRQFKIEGQGFEALDFRFDKPIIKLK